MKNRDYKQKVIDEFVISSVSDKDGNIVDVSKAFLKTMGLEKDDMLGKKLEHIKERPLPENFIQKAKETIASNDTWTGEVKQHNKDGQEFWTQTTITPIFDEDNNRIGQVTIQYDITEKKQLERLSITDGLTDLYNRRHFNTTLSREVKRLKREKKILSFIILDIDYFKRYNDTYGHQAGDEALKAVASAIRDLSRRGGDFVFRLGGEEFGILFSGLDKDKSLEFAESIRKGIEDLQIPHSRSTVAKVVTVSIGLFVIDFSQESIDENGLYSMADSALYEAKEAGRNQVVLYGSKDLEFF